MAQAFNKQYADLNTEFYTTEETVRQLIPFLDKTKRYIEPFDRMANSQIYRVLKENGFDIVRLGTDYSKDDDYDGRIIITNPPFISRGGLYSKMSKQCEEMYLIMPVFSFNAYTKNRSKDKCHRFSDDWDKEALFPVKEFDTPDGKKKVSCIFTHWKKGATMSKLKCPFCNRNLHKGEDGIYSHLDYMTECKGRLFDGSKELWQELIRTRKALGYAIDVIQTVAKMSDKLSREYGETLVEQLDNIQAYCWQEGYVLTHEEDLSKALEQKDVK